MMNNPSWDDGSLAPTFIRLAWHSSGTYDKATGTGGSNGAGMRFSTEAADPENAGLEAPRAFLEPVKRRFPGISYSDLWVLASFTLASSTFLLVLREHIEARVPGDVPSHTEL